MKFKNYLFDLYHYFPKGFSLYNRKDPDVCSKALYDDLCKMFFDDDSKEKLKITSVCNKCQNFGNGDFYTLFIDKDKYLLSSDYIGASIYWARKAGLNDRIILDHLSISRTIGGHILFPRGGGKSETVNTARGGKPRIKNGIYKGYYDRFDLTLYAIKEWFAGNNNSKIDYAIENYREWFELFFDDDNCKNGFEKFVEFFKLEGFIYEQNKIIDLIKSDLENNQVVFLDKEDIRIASTEEEYIRYMKNLNIIILERTKKILL
ncbi:DUF6994 family protein [Streptococcus pseudopneumoniae]|uniref:DUF6994 family protein n=1 Tax=Streptococcus pseudopneumoniae TaxID=257758 RepID=UPI0009A19784|nr:hypothetical protein [Streptococcus pseudopneumoniae]OOR84970.1 hypothetical protein B0178_06605 [Streptococcus pseudopneumoniae]